MNSFALILQKLVDGVPGARGAVFSAGDGEPVAAVGSFDGDDIRMLGAHCAVLLAGTRDACSRLEIGESHTMTLVNERATVLVLSVQEGYFLTFAVRGGLWPLAAHAAKSAVQALRSEIG